MEGDKWLIGGAEVPRLSMVVVPVQDLDGHAQLVDVAAAAGLHVEQVSTTLGHTLLGLVLRPVGEYTETPDTILASQEAWYDFAIPYFGGGARGRKEGTSTWHELFHASQDSAVRVRQAAEGRPTANYPKIAKLVEPMSQSFIRLTPNIAVINVRALYDALKELFSYGYDRATKEFNQLGEKRLNALAKFASDLLPDEDALTPLVNPRDL